MKLVKTTLLAAAAVAFSATAFAGERVTYKAAKTSTSYFQMAVQVSEAVRAATNGEVIVTVEESQGSVQNVMEAAVRPGNYMFTTPPALVPAAQNGKGPFKGRENPRFDEIRSMFPIPGLSMHFVVRSDRDIKSFDDLAGKKVLIGKGTYGAREAARYLDLFGVKDKVEIIDVELSNAVPALKNGQIDAFATSSSFPAPNVMEASAGSDVSFLSLSDEQIAQTGSAKAVIPANTYSNQEEAINTTTLPVIVYATTQMSEDTAYTITKAFWDQKAAMAENAAWWAGITTEDLGNIKTKMHPGALKYYDEVGVEIPAALR
ncbi:TAXI family TRAP transporter solute-binding subunit [Rhodobacteraceae bacterium RKSG542]|uniref:TAXI family TRAP transporter solute-binding subunit n=1 Tax=Pseudovibrio flavus TaxID=2529854 RepID=UPI0012BB9011|nr:TAXI family TRAP transporter solute-binding subunit [Pseudovibrio flavus]MTI16021.1 TAXI family TRAP transporter solute-binding subunit [Pseudovibrio flavus]